MKKVVILVVLSCLLLTGCSVKKVEQLSDSEKFAKEYDISKNNPFIYSNYDEIIEILKKDSAIILFANSDDETSRKAVEIINKVAKENKVEKIYYFNPKKLKDKQPKKYKNILNELKKDISEYELKLPTLYAVKDGKIINYSDSFSEKEQLSEEYLTKKKLKSIKEKYLSIFNYEEE